MIQGALKKIFGSRNERLLKQYGRTVREINALEPQMSRLSDDELRAVLTQIAIYCGIPVGVDCFRTAKTVLAADKKA